ncbi:sigma-70 family RNA polymerase sigma factor [Wenjunlia tyrosinilytica]|uniref:RNA polymerase sigma factor n=1 Tax=Wenjunlia tyrosinilytica TaxID=1544741 RepID=A0A917ZXK3_9ACTN|nr:sigma-70 family RNA polymerase sigma factor [Wenjunlia tyrosinilytica]GGO95775.1 RNA polymerase sigma factor [Wenjunlia tyrosinilytica]
MGWRVIGSTGADNSRERALRTLYDQHADVLHAYVLRLIGGDRHKAEDIVQETLLRCWRKSDLDDERSLRPWLFKVARNLVIDTHRLRAARPQEVDGSAWHEHIPAEVDDIDQMLSSIVVAHALEALSPAHQEVLRETYFAGRSAQAAAAVLGIPVGTVKSRIHYALRALRLAMEERGVDTAGSCEQRRRSQGAQRAGRAAG